MMWGPFLVGLAGGLHCVSMCSPLVLAVTARSTRVWTARILYNAGRLLTYGVLGTAAAATSVFASLAAYQSVFSIVLGVVLTLMALGLLSGVYIPILNPLAQKTASWIRQRFATQLQGTGMQRHVFLGMLNGLLPCGLTYAMALVATTMPTPQMGFQYMIFFGLGTIPVMIGMPWLLGLVSRSRLMMPHLAKVTKVVMIVVGLTLIVRPFLHHHPVVERHEFSEPVICRE